MNAELTFTAKNAVVENVTLVDGTTESFNQVADFDPASGILSLEASDDHLSGAVAMDKTIEVAIKLDGYREDIIKSVTVATSTTKPSITVKQTDKINLFYTEGETTLQITAKGMEIADVEMVDTTSFDLRDFNAETGMVTLYRTYSEDETKADTSATLLVYPDGYETPIAKTFSIKTVTTKPSLALTPASSIINVALEDNRTTFIAVYDKTYGGMVLNPEEVTVTFTKTAEKEEFATYAVDEGGILLTLTGEAGGTATIMVKLDNWTQPIKLTHKVTVQTKLPTPVLGTSTLKLNRIFTEETAETTAKLNQSNYGIAGIEFIPISADAKDIVLSYANGIITASFKEEMDSADVPNNGNYKFECRFGLEGNNDVVLKKTITVNVSSTVPTVKLKTSTLKLNRIFTETTAETTATLSQSKYDIVKIDFDPVTAGSEGIELKYENGVITAYFDGNMETAPKNGNYKFNYVVTLNNEAQTQLAKKTITVNVSSTVPTVKLKTSTLKLNTNLGTLATAETAVTMSKFDGYSLVDMEFSAPDDIEVVFNSDDGTVSAYLVNPDAATKKHTLYLYPILENDATENPVKLSSAVKMTVEVKPYTISASISTKGKLDTMNPDSAITYTINKLNNIVGEVTDVSLAGDDAELFKVKLDTTGSKPVVKLTREDGAQVATNVTYKLQLKLTVQMSTGQTSIVTNISFKVSQSALKFLTIPTQKLYLCQNELVTTVTLNTPAAATLGEITLNSKTAAAFKRAMGDGEIEVDIDGRSAEVRFEIEHPAYLVNGKSYTVYLDVTPAGNATNVKPTQIKLTVKAYK